MRTQSREEDLRHQVALGWVMNGAVLAISFGFMIIESALMNNNFRSVRADLGGSIGWLVYVVALYPLMPVYIHLVHALRPRALRWLAVAVAALGFVFFTLHHLSHWFAGQRLDLRSHAFDVAIEVISLWVLYNSVRWARLPRGESS
jgi:hypothetical protein